MFSSGTMVEVSTVIDKSEVAWFPAMIVKEIEVDDETKFIVKDCNKHLSFDGDKARTNTTVDSCRVRPTPPPFPVEEYKLLDRVEAFGGSVWRQGLVRGVLARNRYMVSLGTTKEESVFKHSDLRPCKVWEDGVWQDGPKVSYSIISINILSVLIYWYELKLLCSVHFSAKSRERNSFQCHKIEANALLFWC